MRPKKTLGRLIAVVLCYRFCCASCILAMLSVRYIVNAIYYHHIQHLYALKISSFAGRKHEQSFCGRRGLPLAATRSVLQGSKCCHPAPELRRRNVRKRPGCSCRLGKAYASKQTSVLQLWDGTRCGSPHKRYPHHQQHQLHAIATQSPARPQMRHWS